MKIKEKIVAFVLILSLLLPLCIFCVFAAEADNPTPQTDEMSAMMEKSAKYLCETASNPSLGSEWTIIALKRSNADVPQEYYDLYVNNLRSKLKEKGALDNRRYTEYARIILALSAIGENPESFSGINLLKKLADFDGVITQGINGAIYALIALDCKNYTVPSDSSIKTQASREMYVDYILKRQHDDGGFSLSEVKNAKSDPDVTAMSIQALLKYNKDSSVATAIKNAFDFLSTVQNSDGGYTSMGNKASESSAQVLIALSSAQKDALINKNYVKQSNTVYDNLKSYYIDNAADNSGFSHLQSNKKINVTATEQALCALSAYIRFYGKINGIYDMTREFERFVKSSNTVKTFSDIKNHKYKSVIEEMVGYGIVDSASGAAFNPDSLITRGEFSVMIVKALKIPQKKTRQFSDVPYSSSQNGYIGAALDSGIVTGHSNDIFNPQQNITYEQAVLFILRAARFCGFNCDFTPKDSKSLSDEYKYHDSAYSGSLEAISFCRKYNIVPDGKEDIEPKKEMTKVEMTVLLYRLLDFLGYILK